MDAGIVWIIGGIIFQVVFFSDMPEMPQSPELENFEAMRSMMILLTVLVGGGNGGALCLDHKATGIGTFQTRIHDLTIRRTRQPASEN